MTRILRIRCILFSSGLILLLLAGGCKALAQKSGKEDIRNAYREANTQIERCQEEGSPCGLYLNQIKTNSGEEPWAVVGSYRSTRDLWYLRDGMSEGECYYLLKVNTTTRRSSRLENEEYLFSAKGQLQFYYFRMGEGNETLQEFRYYFEAGKLIDYVEEVKAEEEEYRELSRDDAEKVLEKAERMQALLQATL